MSLVSTFKIIFGFIYRLTSGLISALHPDFFLQPYICPHNQLTVGLTLDFFLQPYIWPHNQLTFSLTLDFFLQPYIYPHNQLTFGLTPDFFFSLTFGFTISLHLASHPIYIWPHIWPNIQLYIWLYIQPHIHFDSAT